MTGPCPPGDPSGGAEALIEEYLARVRSRFLGRSRCTAAADDLCAELRDHLLSELDQRAAGGADARTAARQALAGFGSADALAAGMRAELVRRPLRRLSLTLLAIATGAATTWQLVLRAGPAEPWTERTEPAPVAALDVSGVLTGVATILAAALGLALIAGPGRRPAGPRIRAAGQRWAWRACWASLVLGIVAAAQLAAYLVLRVLVDPRSLAWPVVIATAIVTSALPGTGLVTSLRETTALRGS